MFIVSELLQEFEIYLIEETTMKPALFIVIVRNCALIVRKLSTYEQKMSRKLYKTFLYINASVM